MWCVIGYCWGEISDRLVNGGPVFQLWQKSCPQLGKKKIYWSAVKVRVRIKLRQVVVMVRLRVNLQEINASLCNIPKSDHGLINVCVDMSVCICVVATMLFSRSVQRIVKDSSCDAAGYLQPRLLQKLNCHAEGGNVSWTENLNNEKPHERLRKERQLCGNPERQGNRSCCKLMRFVVNLWGRRVFKKKKKWTTTTTTEGKCGQTHKQACLLAWGTRKGARRQQWFSGVGRPISGFVSLSSCLNLGFVRRRCWVKVFFFG